MVPAGNVAIGTSIQTRAGPQLQLSTLVRHAYGQTVFNFTVEDFHTYFVGNSPQNALWVHNAGEFNCDGVVPDNGGDQNLPTDFDGEGAPADHNANDDVGKTPNSLKLTPAQNSLWEKGFQNSYAARESIPYDQRGYIDPRTGQPAPYERTIVTSEALKSRSSKQVAETFKPTISGGDIGSQANPSPAPNGFYTGDGTDGWGKFSADENGGYGNGTKPETHADVKTVDQWEHCANEHPNESYSFHMDIDHPKTLARANSATSASATSFVITKDNTKSKLLSDTRTPASIGSTLGMAMKLSLSILSSKRIQRSPRCVNFTSDGQSLIIGSLTSSVEPERVGVINLFDTRTLSCVLTYSVPDKHPNGFAVDLNGRNIVTYGWQGVSVRDVLTGEVLASTPQMCFECACFSDDGNRLVLSQSGNAFFTFDIKSQVLVKGLRNDMATTAICPVSDNTFLIAIVTDAGAGFGFVVMQKDGVLTNTSGRFNGVDFESSYLLASFDRHNNRVCAVDSTINVFGFPQTDWLASINQWGEFVYPDPNAAFYQGGIQWSNPIFLGSSGILACSSSSGLLFIDTNTKELIAREEVERGGQMLAYHEGRQLLASVDVDGLCIVRQISITK